LIIKRVSKIVLLIFGLFPFIYAILFFTIVGSGEKTTSLVFSILFFLAFISIPFTFIFYVVDVLIHKSVPKDQKYLWIALLFFGNILVFPVYWYSFVWRKPEKGKISLIEPGKGGVNLTP
jgi:hypothetical protein